MSPLFPRSPHRPAARLRGPARLLRGRAPVARGRAGLWVLARGLPVMCHQFRRERAPVFFATPRRGPRTRPKKAAAHDTIIALRKQNYSVYEISAALKEGQLPLSPTAVREVLKAEGFAALPRRWTRNGPPASSRRLSPWPMCAHSPWPPAGSPRAAGACSCSSRTSFAGASPSWPGPRACPVRR